MVPNLGRGQPKASNCLAQRKSSYVAVTSNMTDFVVIFSYTSSVLPCTDVELLVLHLQKTQVYFGTNVVKILCRSIIKTELSCKPKAPVQRKRSVPAKV